MRKYKDETDCADCICRVCARNNDNDCHNGKCEFKDCYCGCEVNKFFDLEEDCIDFLPDEE